MVNTKKKGIAAFWVDEQYVIPYKNIIRNLH